jgi:pyroglutamyl-peptidase
VTRRLLVTGFGPFPRMKRNPSEGLARRLAADPRWRRLGIEVRALVMETSWAAIERDLLPAIHAFAPDVVLMLGVAGRRKRVAIETRALNRVTRLMPDAQGRVGEKLAYRAGEARELRSHAPHLAMMQALRERGVPSYLSRDAGRYLCNAAYYEALRKAASSQFSVVFIHIPKPSEKFMRNRAGQKELSSAASVAKSCRSRSSATSGALHQGIMNAMAAFIGKCVKRPTMNR